jgi:hypothetical protein
VLGRNSAAQFDAVYRSQSYPLWPMVFTSCWQIVPGGLDFFYPYFLLVSEAPFASLLPLFFFTNYPGPPRLIES